MGNMPTDCCLKKDNSFSNSHEDNMPAPPVASINKADLFNSQ
jgi:hypothetical protein